MFNSIGVDFSVDTLTRLDFGPEDVRQPVIFRILDDAVPEDPEGFTLFLTATIQEASGLRIDPDATSTVINIIDNDSESSIQHYCWL